MPNEAPAAKKTSALHGLCLSSCSGAGQQVVSPDNRPMQLWGLSQDVESATLSQLAHRVEFVGGSSSVLLQASSYAKLSTSSGGSLSSSTPSESEAMPWMTW